jgi:O-antigen/teichoic acid export membrane protein
VLQSHWALVLGYLVGKAAFTFMLIWAEPTRPRLPTADTKVGQLLRFGGILTADRILSYARGNIDVALVGALLGSRMLGLYIMATALARLPFEKLGSAFEPVAYPTFVRLRDDKAELRRYFRVLSLGTMAVALPMCFGLIVTANMLVPTVIGSQWTAVVRPLQIAAIFTPLIFHLTIVSALLNAMGRVELNLRITTLTSLLTIGGVLVGVRFGIVGVAAASGIAFAIVWVYAEMLALRMIDLHWRDVGETLLPALSASIGMLACVFAASLLTPAGWPRPARLGVECAVGVATYIAWPLLLHRDTVLRQLRLLRTAWGTR